MTKKGKTLNKNKQDTIRTSKEHYNCSIIEGEDEEIEDMPETEFRKLIVGLLRNSLKQMHHLNEKLSQ